MNEDKLVTVCVDVMGGDKEPAVIFSGIEEALELDDKVNILVVGNAEYVEEFAAKHQGRVEALVTTENIEMDEHPAQAVMQKKDSSIVQGCKAVKKGRADAFFSAGSTGAVHASATINIGRLNRQISRPAITSVLPGATPTVILDLGANADCDARQIVQFAKMGTVYSRVIVGVKDPQVGLLNIGTEDTKGSEKAQEYFAALKEELPNFAGNGEGRDYFSDSFDVMVSDGFTGNVALKTLEGTARFIMDGLKKVIMGSTKGKIAGMLLRDGLRELKDSLSDEKYGGAVLLGLRNPVLIGHGATSKDAVANAIAAATQAVRSDLVGRIADEFEKE